MKRPTRRRKSRPGRSSDVFQYTIGGLLLVVSIAAIAAVGWYYASLPKRSPLDAVSGCPIDGPTALNIVVIDSTDELPEPAKKQIETKILLLARSLGQQPGTLLQLRRISLTEPSGSILFSHCSPGDGTDVSPTTGNPELAKKRWREEFWQPIQELNSVSYLSDVADQSPILETLQSIGVETLEPFGVTGRPISLLVISDMRQHTGAYSQYTNDLTYRRFRESPAYRQLHTNLGKAKMDILYVQRRHPKIDEAAHIMFWNEWALDNGSELMSVERLQGEN